MIPVETIPRSREEGMKENGRGGALMYNIFDTL
jgi:hypothetical protein